jgi:hypothetical protein
MSVSGTSTVLSMPPPQQPALQLIYDTAPIGLAFLSPAAAIYRSTTFILEFAACQRRRGPPTEAAQS